MKEMISAKNVYKDFFLSSPKKFFDRKKKKITVLDDLNFSVSLGESIGLVGPNGAGKTTLLKLIARILSPTRGELKISGKSVAFFEMGAGFHEELTLLENIPIIGILHGMTRQYMKENTSKILSLAGLSDYKNSLFHDLSQGMKAKLALSTVLFLKADIFLLDEALAAGDISFRHTCFDVFDTMKKEGKIIFLTSHDHTLIQSVCSKTMYLKNGKITAFGDSVEVLRTYQEDSK